MNRSDLHPILLSVIWRATIAAETLSKVLATCKNTTKIACFSPGNVKSRKNAGEDYRL